MPKPLEKGYYIKSSIVTPGRLLPVQHPRNGTTWFYIINPLDVVECKARAALEGTTLIELLPGVDIPESRALYNPSDAPREGTPSA